MRDLDRIDRIAQAAPDVAQDDADDVWTLTEAGRDLAVALRERDEARAERDEAGRALAVALRERDEARADCDEAARWQGEALAELAALRRQIADDAERDADVTAALRTVQTPEERLRAHDRLLFAFIVEHEVDVMAPDDSLGIGEWTVSAHHRCGDVVFRSAYTLGDAIIRLRAALFVQEAA